MQTNKKFLNISKKQFTKGLCCGSACLQLIFKYYNIIADPPKDIFWVFQAGSALLDHRDVKVYSYNSNIFNNFEHLNRKYLIEKVRNMQIEPFNSLHAFLSKGGKIIFGKITTLDIETALKAHKLILCIVNSSVFFNEHRQGGHYIIIFGYTKQDFIICSPGKVKYDALRMARTKLLNAIEQEGGWYLFV